MPLNKFAGFGMLLPPLPAPPSSADRVATALNGVAAAQAPLVGLAGAVAASANAVAAAINLNNPNAALSSLAGALGTTGTVIDRLDLLIKAVHGGRVPTPTVPSQAAFTIVASLGQVRDALCDQQYATVATVNAQLGKAKNSKSILASAALLAAQTALLAKFNDQFVPLGSAIDFETQRRERLAQLLAFELTVLAEV